VVLVGRDSVGKSTILADAAAWYASRGRSVVVATFEGFDEWNDLVDAYSEDEKWYLYDWKTGGLSLNETDCKFDAILIDPAIGFFTYYGATERSNTDLRRLLHENVELSLKPGGHIWIAWHTGHDNQHRARGPSDASAWARMTMLYKRALTEQAGRLTVTRTNRGQGTHKALEVTVGTDNRAVIRPAGGTTKDDRLRQILAHIKDDPGTSPGKLAERLELSKSTISGYLPELDGKITKVKRGRGVELYLSDADSSAAPGGTPSPAPNYPNPA